MIWHLCHASAEESVRAETSPTRGVHRSRRRADSDSVVGGAQGGDQALAGGGDAAGDGCGQRDARRAATAGHRLLFRRRCGTHMCFDICLRFPVFRLPNGAISIQSPHSICMVCTGCQLQPAAMLRLPHSDGACAMRHHHLPLLSPGFYGSSDSNTFNEGSASGQDYLAEVCREWEAAANAAQVSQAPLRRLIHTNSRPALLFGA